METFTYKATSFTFHGLDQDSKFVKKDNNASIETIRCVRGFLVDSPQDFVFQVANSRIPNTLELCCLSSPNTEAGLLMRCKGVARLSCYFETKLNGVTVLSNNANCGDSQYKDGLIFKFANYGSPLTFLFLRDALIEYCRSASNTITVSISSTPLPSAKILFDALRSGPSVSLKTQVRTLYDQVSWDIHLVSKLDAKNASASESNVVRAHRAVLERYEGFREVLVPEVKVVGGSGSLEAQKAGEPSRKRTRGNDADIKPDIALLDTSSLPKFALDEDFQTIRAIVKFIYTGDIDFWVSHVLPSVCVFTAGRCEAKAAWAAADRYGFPELKSAATRFIIENLSIDTVLSDLVLGQDSEELKTLYKAYIKLNLVKVKESPSVVEVMKELSRKVYPTTSGELLAEVVQTMIAEE